MEQLNNLAERTAQRQRVIRDLRAIATESGIPYFGVATLYDRIRDLEAVRLVTSYTMIKDEGQIHPLIMAAQIEAVKSSVDGEPNYNKIKELGDQILKDQEIAYQANSIDRLAQ